MGRLVFVPHNFFHSHSHNLTINGTSVPGNVETTDYSPSHAVEALYRLRDMTDHTTTWCPVSPTEVYMVETWIAENCSRDVIAIPQTNYSYGGGGINDFTLHFLDGWPARDKFLFRHEAPKNKQRFEAYFPDKETAKEAVAWVTEHMTKGCDVVALTSANVIFTVHDEHQAVGFKLRWCDYLRSV